VSAWRLPAGSARRGREGKEIEAPRAPGDGKSPLVRRPGRLAPRRLAWVRAGSSRPTCCGYFMAPPGWENPVASTAGPPGKEGIPALSREPERFNGPAGEVVGDARPLGRELGSSPGAGGTRKARWSRRAKEATGSALRLGQQVAVLVALEGEELLGEDEAWWRWRAWRRFEVRGTPHWADRRALCRAVAVCAFTISSEPPLDPASAAWFSHRFGVPAALVVFARIVPCLLGRQGPRRRRPGSSA
jgi:hypothetical protein